MPEIAPAWPLMIGECVYNLRCALDHLWWELAIDHLGREPTPREAPSIQFPILTRLDPSEFENHRFVAHVADAAAQRAKQLQAFDRAEDQDSLLQVLADLSNHDKHRSIQPTYFRPFNVSTTIGNVPCVDCHIPKSDLEEAEWTATIGFPDWDGVQVGDEVLRQEVVPTGPNPDIHSDPEIRLIIGFGPELSVLHTLKNLGRLVQGVLVQFAPLLKSTGANHS